MHVCVRARAFIFPLSLSLNCLFLFLVFSPDIAMPCPLATVEVLTTFTIWPSFGPYWRLGDRLCSRCHVQMYVWCVYVCVVYSHIGWPVMQPLCTWMYVCVHACIRMYIFIYMYIHIYMYIYICIYKYMHIYIYIYIYIYVQMYISIYIYIYIYIHIYMYVFIYIHIYTYIYTCTHKHIYTCIFFLYMCINLSVRGRAYIHWHARTQRHISIFIHIVELYILSKERM